MKLLPEPKAAHYSLHLGVNSPKSRLGNLTPTDNTDLSHLATAATLVQAQLLNLTHPGRQFELCEQSSGGFRRDRLEEDGTG